MRALLIILLFLAGNAGAIAGPLEDPLEEAKVRAEAIARMHAAGVFDTVEAQPDGTIALTWGDGDANSYLGNLILDMQAADPAARSDMLDAFVATAVGFATRDGSAIHPEELRLNVNTTAYIDWIKAAEMQDGGSRPPDEIMQLRRHVAGDLWALIVQDSQGSAWWLDEETLLGAGIPVEDAWKRAEANLRERASALRLVPNGDYWALQLDGVYENAIMLLHDVWPEIAGMIRGTPVAATPARGILLVAPAEDVDLVERLAAEAEQLYRSRGHPLSRHLYRWTGEGWETW